MPTARSFARFAWGVLAYNLAVVVFGAFVRASGSGAGCGSHWPLCNGEVIPRPERIETLIEFSHRASSGLDALLVVALAVWGWRAARNAGPARRPLRVAAVAALVFLVFEALVGAALVRYDLVVDNASTARAWVIGAHLCNTFLLLAALALTAFWAGGGAPPRRRADAVGWLLAGGFVLLLVLGVSGAITALGDTLFPAASFRAGLARDFSPGAHFLLRLRVFHPPLAIASALYLVGAAMAVGKRLPAPEVRRWARWFTLLLLAQILLGFANLGLAAPIGLQLTHLLIADLVWIAWVLLAAAALGAPTAPTTSPA
jgi:heme A synthase